MVSILERQYRPLVWFPAVPYQFFLSFIISNKIKSSIEKLIAKLSRVVIKNDYDKNPCENDGIFHIPCKCLGTDLTYLVFHTPNNLSNQLECSNEGFCICVYHLFMIKQNFTNQPKYIKTHFYNKEIPNAYNQNEKKWNFL